MNVSNLDGTAEMNAYINIRTSLNVIEVTAPSKYRERGYQIQPAQPSSDIPCHAVEYMSWGLAYETLLRKERNELGKKTKVVCALKVEPFFNCLPVMRLPWRESHLLRIKKEALEEQRSLVGGAISNEERNTMLRINTIP